MKIPDLSYLQSVPEDEFILGSFGVSVISQALSFGSDNYPFASASSTATSFSGDDSISYGIGLAEASGAYSTAQVGVAGDGDIVIEKIKYKSYKNTALASGFVIAIDLPYNLTFL